MDDDDQPLDDEDRALRYITERARRFKARVILPCVVLGTVAGFAAAAMVGVDGGGKARVLLAFAAPFIGSVALCTVLLRLALPRVVARWLIEAAARFRVPRRSLIGLVRGTVLSVPNLDAGQWAAAATKLSGGPQARASRR